MDVPSDKKNFWAGGTQDNGTFVYDINANPQWEQEVGGDGGATVIDWSDSDVIYARLNPRVYKSVTGGSSFSNIATIPVTNNNGCTYSVSTGGDSFLGLIIQQHPKASDSLFVAKKRLFRQYDSNGNPRSQCSPDIGSGEVLAYGVSPSNPNIIYFSINGEVYKSTDTGLSWVITNTWINNDGGSQTTGPPHQVNHIVVDPEDPNHFWVGSGSFNYTGTPTINNGIKRVLEVYCDNNNCTYNDISNGLPPIPVNTFIREDESGVIYAGTDVGVYRYDPKTYNPNTYDSEDNPEAGWQCFNMGLPPAIVTDLKINHCEKKLYASTFGRGVFSSPLYEDEANAIIINTDENRVWSAGPAMYAHNDIIVRDGAKLTVKTTLYMSGKGADGEGDRTAIIVEPGGVLEVIDGTITAPCDQTWAGIYIEGNFNAPQIPTINQGRVYLSNAVIENAHDAIATKSRTGTAWFQATTGGIVTASNTTFRNNKRDVEFLQYYNKSLSGTEVNNISGFILCDFNITDEYRFSTIKPFVTMWDVHGVYFKGCEFEDIRSGIGSDIAANEMPSDKIGIRSKQASFRVNEKCNGIGQPWPPPPSCDGVPTKFVNLNYGIRSYGDRESFNISVKNSEFECWHGIYLNDNDDGIVQSNNFLVKRAPMPKVSSYGLYLDASRGYSAENNTFGVENPLSGGIFPTDVYAGIVVRNKHGDGELIYRNNFSDFIVAVEAIGYNRQDIADDEASGLEFRCNDFASSRHDMFIVQDLNNPAPTGTALGIKPIQDLPANLFSYNPTATWSHISNDPGISQLTYIHHSTANNSRVKPTIYQGSVSIDGTNPVPFDSSTCPDNLASGGLSGLTLGELENIKTTKGEVYEQIKTDLQTLIDGGETEELKEDVENATFQSAYSIYQDVLQKESFVSDTVLRQISKKETGFTTGMIRDMLASSPQAAKSEAIQQNLDERTVQLPEYMRQQINMGMTITSAKEQMELEAARHKNERDQAIHQGVRLLASDSIDRTEEMINFLSNTGDIGFEYRLAALHDARGETALADEVLDAIGQRDLTEKQADDHADYISFRSLLQSWKQAGKNLITLDETDIISLEAYVEQQNITSGKAMTILAMNGHEYDEPVYLPSPPIEERRIMEEETLIQISEDILKIYPNPARQYFTIEYAVAKDAENLYLEVSDINGDVVYKKQLDYRQDQIIVPADHLPTGQYFCYIKINNTIIKTEKFVLVK